MAYQSLYRRYRPQKFAEIKGQDHVVRALQTAVRTGKVGHAYLLHGPRGSGKTSTARVLAKALNCPHLSDDGEPCGGCESCVSIQQGRSFDLQELDAASNNKVDDMRTLLERVNLASPGQAKVYLLDEVHMLTAGAENALLKTLEEPPSHVTWVLATTEPHKVVQTIRSRCQVFELGLVSSDIMSDHLRFVVADAELDVDDEAIDHAVASGDGSVRDTLTALERVVAGGATTDLDSSTDAILAAVAEGDPAAALSAVGDAVGRGRDPRTIGEMVLAGLRDAFLTEMGDPPARLSEHERSRAADLADRMAPAAMTRALEVLGRALIDMRQAPDPRIDIEVALVRLCHPDEDRSLEALAQRVRQLEARLDGSGATGPSASHSPSAPARHGPAAGPAPRAEPQASSAASSQGSSAAAAARRALAEQRAADSASGRGSGTASAAPSRPAAASGVSGSPGSADSPVAAARRALAEQRAASSASGSGSAAPSAPSRPAAGPGGAGVSGSPGPPPPPVPAPDLASMRPGSPTEVVELARRHLGLDKDFVVERALSLEPDRDRRREPAQLQALWRSLLDHANKPSAAPETSAPESPVSPATAAEPAAPSGPRADTPEPTPSGPRADTPEPTPSGPRADTPEPTPSGPRADTPEPTPSGPGTDTPEPTPSGPEPPADTATADPSVANSPVATAGPAAATASTPATKPAAATGSAVGSGAGLGTADLYDEFDEVDSLDLANLDDLDEAPSHAHDIEQKIKAVFPGTKFAVLPDPEDDGGAGCTA